MAETCQTGNFLSHDSPANKTKRIQTHFALSKHCIGFQWNNLEILHWLNSHSLAVIDLLPHQYSQLTNYRKNLNKWTEKQNKCRCFHTGYDRSLNGLMSSKTMNESYPVVFIVTRSQPIKHLGEIWGQRISRRADWYGTALKRNTRAWVETIK